MMEVVIKISSLCASFVRFWSDDKAERPARHPPPRWLSAAVAVDQRRSRSSIPPTPPPPPPVRPIPRVRKKWGGKSMGEKKMLTPPEIRLYIEITEDNVKNEEYQTEVSTKHDTRRGKRWQRRLTTNYGPPRIFIGVTAIFMGTTGTGSVFNPKEKNVCFWICYVENCQIDNSLFLQKMAQSFFA